MMRLLEKPYISEYIKHPRRVLKRFIKGKFVPGIYIIRFADDPDQLEIIKSEYYKQKYIMNEDKLIVGFAADYDDACDMVIDLVGKSYAETGIVNIKNYILK